MFVLKNIRAHRIGMYSNVLKTFVRLMFVVLAIRELFLTVNFCQFTVNKWMPDN